MISNQTYVGGFFTKIIYEYTYGTQEIKGPASSFLEYFLLVSGYPTYGTPPLNVITGNSSSGYTYTLDADGNISSLTDGSYTATFNF
jgi:hypothetical protein